jgi:hypothetical protein
VLTAEIGAGALPVVALVEPLVAVATATAPSSAAFGEAVETSLLQDATSAIVRAPLRRPVNLRFMLTPVM